MLLPPNSSAPKPIKYHPPCAHHRSHILSLFSYRLGVDHAMVIQQPSLCHAHDLRRFPPPPSSTTRRTAVPRMTRVIAAASSSRCVLVGARETTLVVLRPDRPSPPQRRRSRPARSRPPSTTSRRSFKVGGRGRGAATTSLSRFPPPAGASHVDYFALEAAARWDVCYKNKVLWYLHTVLTYQSHVTSL